MLGMRLFIWSLVFVFTLGAIFVYSMMQGRIAAIEYQSVKMQKEVDQVLEDFKTARDMVCDGVCPKG